MPVASGEKRGALAPVRVGWEEVLGISGCEFAGGRASEGCQASARYSQFRTEVQQAVPRQRSASPSPDGWLARRRNPGTGRSGDDDGVRTKNEPADQRRSRALTGGFG